MAKYFFSAVIFLIFISFASVQESITITTYYLSPYGSYNDLTVAQNLRLESSPNSPASQSENDILKARVQTLEAKLKVKNR